MSLTFEEYKDRAREIIELPFNTSSPAGGALWDSFAGAQTTPVLCDHLTVGAIGENVGFRFDEEYYILGLEVNSVSQGSFGLIDRLAHQGGLNGTTGGSEQTTNFPLGAGITRYDPVADRIQAAVRIITAVGATATTLVANYTNSANVAGQASQPIVFGGTGFSIAQRFMEIPPADGQKFKTIEGITLAASTGTAGNFGLVLFTKLMEGYSRPWGHAGHYGINLHNWYTGDMDLPIARVGACLTVTSRFGNTGGYRGVVRLMRKNP